MLPPYGVLQSSYIPTATARRAPIDEIPRNMYEPYFSAGNLTPNPSSNLVYGCGSLRCSI